ncbi:MAG TPA: glycoside hydrolase family 43 protein [Polyangiaceae bacterium]|jgi:hypothetical protein|nr:glycoside hydrolase family 43 protein [Polyangiaceae bacterium]
MTLPFVRRLPLIWAGLLAQVCLLFPHDAHADNPIVQHVYTADPAPMVNGDTVYLCTSHDEDVTKDNFFTMNDWRVFSTKDMVNWTDHGSPLSYKTFSWATGKAWAPHCVARGGKYYMFVPVSDSIGVAVSDSPTGPFKDAIGKPLLSNYQYIDPTVFIDTDGQAYLYFGNPKLWYVKLNSDMTSYSGQVQSVSMTTESFGQRSGDADRPTLYEEGPWFYKRNDLYYLMFAMGPLPEKIGYSTSSSATGPWSYKGVIMNNQSGHAFTNHSGVIDFKGHSYFFYHTQELAGGGGYKRSVAVEEFTYKADGTFPTITKTSGGVTQSAAPLNPFERVEGETIAWAPNVEIEDCSEGGRDVTSIENNDSIKVESVNFLTGAVSFSARVAAAGAGGSIELHLDSATGTLLGTCAVPSTGGAQKWQTVSCNVTGATGTKDLFLVFKGGSGSLFNLNFWQFTPKDPLPGGSGGAGGTGASGGSAGMAVGGASPTAGAANGGAPPVAGGASSLGGGSSSSGGYGTGGTSSGGVSPAGGTQSATGGSSSSRGGTGATSSTPGAPTASTPQDDGCTCSAVGGRGTIQSWAMTLVSALVTAAQLRRRRRKAANHR